MVDNKLVLISGTSKGIGKYLASHYTQKGFIVVGCSRSPIDYELENYYHFCADILDEVAVLKMFKFIKGNFNRLDVLINNAGIASMNHILLTPLQTTRNILNTNVAGTFLLCREAAKLMRKNNCGRIINFSSVAVPLNLEGEAIYASSKAAIVKLTQILAYELADFGITVNVIGPTPIKTNLIKAVPQEKIDKLISNQAIKRWGEFRDISNIIDFFIQPESSFITGQTVYLGGIS